MLWHSRSGADKVQMPASLVMVMPAFLYVTSKSDDKCNLTKGACLFVALQIGLKIETVSLLLLALHHPV